MSTSSTCVIVAFTWNVANTIIANYFAYSILLAPYLLWMVFCCQPVPYYFLNKFVKQQIYTSVPCIPTFNCTCVQSSLHAAITNMH